jgi:hypothetical protein
VDSAIRRMSASSLAGSSPLSVIAWRSGGEVVMLESILPLITQ